MKIKKVSEEPQGNDVSHIVSKNEALESSSDGVSVCRCGFIAPIIINDEVCCEYCQKPLNIFRQN
jgi:hypothetical protein